MADSMRIASAHIHHQGQREEQQDQLGQRVWERTHRFFVIDGMGGIKGGAAIASRIRQSLLEPSNNPIEQAHKSIQSWFHLEWSDTSQDALRSCGNGGGHRFEQRSNNGLSPWRYSVVPTS